MENELTPLPAVEEMVEHQMGMMIVGGTAALVASRLAQVAYKAAVAAYRARNAASFEA